MEMCDPGAEAASERAEQPARALGFSLKWLLSVFRLQPAACLRLWLRERLSQGVQWDHPWGPFQPKAFRHVCEYQCSNS